MNGGFPLNWGIMQRIPIKFAVPGMVLVKAVVKEDGMVLAGEGLELSDAVISRLRNAGVPSLAVKGRPLPNLASGLSLPKALERLPHLFRKYPEDQLMRATRGIVEDFLLRAIAREEEERRTEMSRQITGADTPGGQTS